MVADPLSSLPVEPGTDIDLTPANKHGSNSAGRQAKKTAGQKPAPKTVVTVVVATLGGELGEALGKADVGSKARRSKATPVTPRAPSARAKAKLGELTSLESAKLRLADKNLEVTGNPLPSYRILNAFTDDQLASILDDSGVAISAPCSEIISMVRAREEA